MTLTGYKLMVYTEQCHAHGWLIAWIGVGATDIAKLKANGYYTVAVSSTHSACRSLTAPQSVHAATRRTLLKVKGFSEVKVEKVKEAVAKCQVGYDSCRGQSQQTAHRPHSLHPAASLQRWRWAIIARGSSRYRQEANNLMLFLAG